MPCIFSAAFLLGVFFLLVVVIVVNAIGGSKEQITSSPPHPHGVIWQQSYCCSGDGLVVEVVILLLQWSWRRGWMPRRVWWRISTACGVGLYLYWNGGHVDGVKSCGGAGIVGRETPKC